MNRRLTSILASTVLVSACARPAAVMELVPSPTSSPACVEMNSLAKAGSIEKLNNMLSIYGTENKDSLMQGYTPMAVQGSLNSGLAKLDKLFGADTLYRTVTNTSGNTRPLATDGATFAVAANETEFDKQLYTAHKINGKIAAMNQLFDEKKGVNSFTFEVKGVECTVTLPEGTLAGYTYVNPALTGAQFAQADSAINTGKNFLLAYNAELPTLAQQTALKTRLDNMPAPVEVAKVAQREIVIPAAPAQLSKAALASFSANTHFTYHFIPEVKARTNKEFSGTYNGIPFAVTANTISAGRNADNITIYRNTMPDGTAIPEGMDVLVYTDKATAAGVQNSYQALRMGDRLNGYQLGHKAREFGIRNQLVDFVYQPKRTFAQKE